MVAEMATRQSHQLVDASESRDFAALSVVLVAIVDWPSVQPLRASVGGALTWVDWR